MLYKMDDPCLVTRSEYPSTRCQSLTGSLLALAPREPMNIQHSVSLTQNCIFHSIILKIIKAQMD